VTEKKKVIAVIGGTGDLGRGLVLRWARAGYSVIVGSRSANKAIEAARGANDLLGLNTIGGMDNVAAAELSDIVVLTVPYANHASMVADLHAAVQGKIFIDVTVPLRPPQVRTVQLPEGGSVAKSAQTSFGDNVRVVSAFQNIAAAHLQDLHHAIDCDVLVCGNDPAAREEVIALAEAAGMAGWHAGRIDNSAIAEALTSGLIFINGKYGIDGAGIRIVGKRKST
jgi:NADPH-dependent F420 reductase